MKQKKQLQKIIAAFVLFVGGFLVPDEGYWRAVLFTAAYLIVGMPIILKAARNITRGQVFDENFLMTIATLGAFALGEYSEGVAVMLFYQIGELFQSYAVNKSRKSIAELMDIRPDYANVERDGKTVKVSPEEVNVGDIIIVKTGERVPLDGVVVEGYSLLDTAAITGESMPRGAEVGDEVISGCINLNGKLSIRVSRVYSDSTVAKILELVENASSKKAEVENFITKFARYYTPTVVILAVIIAIVPPMFVTGALFSDWVYRALTFLVISCPCALVISVPLGFFGGIGASSRNGVLVKGSNYLEALAAADTVVFDKTGTLTKGSFVVTEVKPQGISEEKLLELAAYVGSSSSHPVSHSIRKAYGKDIDEKKISNIEEISGFGVKAKVFDEEVCLGNAKLMEKAKISFDKNTASGTVVYVAVDGKYRGFIRIADEVKPDAEKAVSELRQLGIKQLVMLTGDTKTAGQEIGNFLKLDKVYTELLPAQKVEQTEKLLAANKERGRLIFVGDGINDAPVLAMADIGIAMGGIGSDAAVEAADVVIMTDEPSKIATAICISQRTLRIVKQNIVFALGVKFLVLAFGVDGLATMWDAVFADVGVTVLAVLNSMRTLKK